MLQGIPPPVVFRLLGHKRSSMTLRYAHVGDRETKAVAERIGTAVARVLGGRNASSLAATTTGARRGSTMIPG